MASQAVWVHSCVVITVSIIIVMVRTSTVNEMRYTNAGVLVETHEANAAVRVHNRSRREISKDMTTFNSEEQNALLRKHNEYRRKERAANMQHMVWNDDLADSAQKYAEECIFQHSSHNFRSVIPGFRIVGENLFVQNIKFQLTIPIKLWYDEVVDYNFETRGCTPQKMCGHYTQIVWATTNSLGCGVKYCPNLRGTRFKSGYNVVCHYGPAGNIVGRDPYIKGKACSLCEKSMPYCIRGLCSSRPAIGSASRMGPSQDSVYLAMIAVVLWVSL